MSQSDTAKPAEALKGEDWAGDMGVKWLSHLDRFEGMIAPIGAALLARAGFTAGERVIDLGCGGGATTRAIAASVAPGGEVVGLDISPDLIREAAARAAAAGLANARFVCGDAAVTPLEGAPFDRLFSRFGSMFFAAPVAAFAHLRSLLKPGARIDLAVWAHPRDNLWMMEMMGVVRQHIDVPPAVPRAPGPFAFEDRDYLGDVLAEAGFSAMEVDAYSGHQAVGGPGASPEDATAFVLGAMAVGRLLAEQDAAVQAAARADLLALFRQRHVTGEGVMMGCKAWLVSARA